MGVNPTVALKQTSAGLQAGRERTAPGRLPWICARRGREGWTYRSRAQAAKLVTNLSERDEKAADAQEGPISANALVHDSAYNSLCKRRCDQQRPL